MDGLTNGWTACLYYTDATDVSKNDDFPTEFAILQKRYGLTDGLLDRPMDQRNNGPTEEHTLL